MATDIFISYSHKDKAKIAVLAHALEQSGKTVWWDPEILPGQNFQDVIQDALHHASCVITAWSETAVKSDYVRAESLWAFTKKNLVSMRLDDVVLPTPFNAIQVADLRHWEGNTTDNEFRKLCRGVDWLISRNNAHEEVSPETAAQQPEAIATEQEAPQKPETVTVKQEEPQQPEPVKVEQDEPQQPEPVATEQNSVPDYTVNKLISTAAAPDSTTKTTGSSPKWPLLAGIAAAIIVGVGIYSFSTQNNTSQPGTNTAQNTSQTNNSTNAAQRAAEWKRRAEQLLSYVKSADDCTGNISVSGVTLEDYIHKAAAGGYITGVQKCLNLGVSVNTRVGSGKDWTPLDAANSFNQKAMIDFLKSKGAY